MQKNPWYWLILIMFLFLVCCNTYEPEPEKEKKPVIKYSCTAEQWNKVVDFTSECASGSRKSWEMDQNLHKCRVAAEKMICNKKSSWKE